MTNQQDSSIGDSQQQLAANHQLATSQSHTSLANHSQLQPLSSSNKQSLAAEKQRHLDSTVAANAQQQQPLDATATLSANLETSKPSLVTKSASSSSVLSSVSLASGAQMKQQQPSTESVLVNKDHHQQQQQTSGEQAPAIPSISKPQDRYEISSASTEIKSSSITSKDSDKLPVTSSVVPDKHLETTNSQNQSIQIIHPDAIKAEQDALALVARDPQIQTPKPQISELKRLLRHTNSLNQLPEFGVETEHEEELGNLTDQIDVWGLNIFEVHTFSQQHSLTAVMYKIFKVSSIIDCENKIQFPRINITKLTILLLLLYNE